jgi:hypothetical protein
MATDELASWIARIRKQAGTQPLDLVLTHALPGEPARTVHNTTIYADGEPSEEAAAEFRAVASAEAGQMRGAQRFPLAANVDGRNVANTTIYTQPTGAEGRSELEPPTPAGQVQQSQRHLEEMTKLSIRAMQAAQDTSQRALDMVARVAFEQGKEIIELRAQAKQDAAALAQARSAEREDQMSQTIISGREQRRTEVVQRAMGLLPAAITGIKNRGGVPPKELARMLGHLSPETRDKLIDELPAEDQAAMLKIIEAGEQQQGPENPKGSTH